MGIPVPGAEPAAPWAAGSPLKFLPAMAVDPGRPGTEPVLATPPGGCALVAAIQPRSLWRRCGDGGFERLPAPAMEFGGTDSDVASVDGTHVWYADLWLNAKAGSSLAWSGDAGATWSAVNPATNPPPVDRPWLVRATEAEVVVVAHSAAGIAAATCRAPVLPLGVAAPPAVPDCAPKGLVVEDLRRACFCPAGRPAGFGAAGIVVPYQSNAPLLGAVPDSGEAPRVMAGVSHDGGASWAPRAVSRDTGRPGFFYMAAADAGGGLYIAWAAADPRDGAWKVWLARSANGGDTWLPAVVVSRGGTNALPAVAAAGTGEVALAWYHRPGSGHPHDAAGPWSVQAVRIRGALGAAPAVEVGEASAGPVHRGGLCVAGGACGAAVDRDLRDFLGLSFDEHGRIHVAFADDEDESGDETHVYYTHEGP